MNRFFILKHVGVFFTVAAIEKEKGGKKERERKKSHQHLSSKRSPGAVYKPITPDPLKACALASLRCSWLSRFK